MHCQFQQPGKQPTDFTEADDAAMEEKDRQVIYICSNYETLRDGRLPWLDDLVEESIDDAIRDACNVVCDAGFVAACDKLFQNWHGGKFYARPTIGGVAFGYKCGFACTLEQNPSAALRAAVDAANDKLTDALDALAKEMEAEAEQQRIREDSQSERYDARENFDDEY